MKIAILLKSGPCTDEADRALQTAADMLAQGHAVSLYLLQEAVRFCLPAKKCPGYMNLQKLIDSRLQVHVLAQDARLRGIEAPAYDSNILAGSYDSLVDLMDSSGRVVGIL